MYIQQPAVYIAVKNIDNRFSRQHELENFTSLIWTEYFNRVGHFELTMEWSLDANRNYTIGKYLSIASSRRIMRIEERYSEVDKEGYRKLILKGYSLENIFNHRVALTNWRTAHDGGIHWESSDGLSVNGMVRWLAGAIRNGAGTSTPSPNMSVFDLNRIRNLGLGRPTGYPSYSDVLANSAVTVPQGNAREAIEALCAVGGLGYRMVMNSWSMGPETSITFDAYTPRNLTRPTDGYVIFSETMNNIESVRTYEGENEYKNAVFVNGDPDGRYISWNAGGSFASDDFGRKIGYEAIDSEREVEQSTQPISGREIRIALAEKHLAEHPKDRLVDGIVDQGQGYEYDRDYILGDLVAFEDIRGIKSPLRVVAQTFVFDERGYSSYPTLESD